MVGEYRFSTVEPIAVHASCYAVDSFSRRHLKDRNRKINKSRFIDFGHSQKCQNLEKTAPKQGGVQPRPAASCDLPSHRR